MVTARMKHNRSTDASLSSALTVDEFLAAIPIPRSSFYQLVRSKRIEAFKVGRRIYVPREVAMKLLTPKE